MREHIPSSKRIVIKLGTGVLENSEGKIDEFVIRNIVRQIAEIRKAGKDVVIVTSGAIGCGMSELGFSKRPKEVKMKQACAAVGQSILMSVYNNCFKERGLKTAQILLTYDDFSKRETYLNMKNSIEALLKLGVIPVINENDSVSIDEIGPSFGDNDRLSALVASKINADLLLILTTVDGLYDCDPFVNKNAKLIREVKEIDSKIENSAGKASLLGVGGMSAKISAAKTATQAGTIVVIANGREKNSISDALSGKEIGTVFYSREKISGKKRWILNSKPKGAITVDKGAMDALMHGKSLLPAGVIDVKGTFSEHDVIEVCSENGVCAKALADCSSECLRAIKGKGSAEASKLQNCKITNVLKRENLIFQK